MKRIAILALGLTLGMAGTAQADDQPVLVGQLRMSMETALKIAQATVEACREEGVQVAATVVDRAGDPQVVLRDVLAPELTLIISKQKAYTAVAFNVVTSELADRADSPLAMTDGLAMFAGGVPIQAGGKLVGAVGVSGAPSGETDEACAVAGLESMQADLDLEAF
jgi:uncharacterized protein GlcG (DUF336 family)